MENFGTIIDNFDAVTKQYVDDKDALKLNKAGGSITGDLTVGGNLTINGTTTTVNSTMLQVKDKLIEVAHGNRTTLTTPAGLVAPKYDGTNSGALVFDSTGTAYVGDVALKAGNIDVANSGLQPLATRTGLVGGNLVQYDSSAQTLKDSGKKISDLALKTDISGLMPKKGGTFTGEVKFGSTENFQGYYIKRMIGGLGAGTAYNNLDSKYKDGTYHRMWRLRFPSGSSFWGKIKITLYGGYSSFNASGVMSKSITCNFNTSNIYNNVGCYDGLGVNVEQDFRISEAIWNSTASAWEVLIWQKNLNGNNSPAIMIECWTRNDTNYINAFNGIAAQTVELTQMASYSAQKASSTGGTKTVEWATLPVYENPLGEEIATVAMLEDKQDKITSSNKLSSLLVDGLGAAAAKAVDTAITSNSTSTNLPTSKAVEDRINAHSGIDKVGTVTGVKMNGTTKNPSSGVVDLGTVITAHQSIKSLKTDNTESQAVNPNEAIAGSGTINLHKVAKTGSYNDLLYTPTIPAAANNGTLTIQKNGTDVATFTADQSSSVTANITVPTKVGQLENDSGFITSDGSVKSVIDYNKADERIKIGYAGASLFVDDIKYIAGYTAGDSESVARIKDIPKDKLKSWLGYATVAESGSYNDLSNAPAFSLSGTTLTITM